MKSIHQKSGHKREQIKKETTWDDVWDTLAKKINYTGPRKTIRQIQMEAARNWKK